jgi:hypothetical protein
LGPIPNPQSPIPINLDYKDHIFHLVNQSNIVNNYILNLIIKKFLNNIYFKYDRL